MFNDLPFSVPVNQMECNFSGRFCLREDLEETRKSIWETTLAKRSSAFDGALLRMTSHTLAGERLTVSASRTSFSAYLATRSADFTQNNNNSERANPLGLTVIVRTADDQIIITIRSLTADQNPGALYLVGGYAEPMEQDGHVDLFDQAMREVEEEIALKDIDRSASFGIGLAYDPEFCHPEMTFLMPSKSTAASILAGAENAPDRNEASQLLACPINQFLDEGGPFANTPQTWSFTKSRQFLREHLRLIGQPE